MREYIDSKDIANTVMMLATAFRGTIAVVEGVTDKRLYGKFFEKDGVETVIAHSKTNVRNAVRMTYRERGFGSVIGIMDADLDYLTERRRSPPLFLTDTRDLEGMLLRSGAYDDILSEYADEEKTNAFEDKGRKVRDAVLAAAYPVGLMMYISETHGLGYSFKDLDYEYFIDRRTLECDVRKLLDIVISRSSSARRVDRKDVLQLYSAEPEHDPWIVCRGHDLMAIMAIGLRHIFGSYNSKGINADQLSGSFRLAYDREDLEGTGLFSETGDWCSRNGLVLWAVRT